MAERPIDLVFPAAGLDRQYSYSRQRPFTTVDAANVRPDATLESRERGGSRPGLIKAINHDTDADGDSEALGTDDGSKIQLLTVMRSTNATGTASYSETFDTDGVLGGGDYTDWEAPPGNWLVAVPHVTDGQAHSLLATEGTYAALLKTTALSVAANSDYGVSIKVVGAIGIDILGYELYAEVNALSAGPTGAMIGVTGKLQETGEGAFPQGAVFSITAEREISETKAAFTVGWNTIPPDGWLELRISAAKIASLYYDGQLKLSLDVASLDLAPSNPASFPMGSQVGFGVHREVTTTLNAEVNAFYSSYVSATGGFPPEALMASAAGKLYAEKLDTTHGRILTQVDNTVALNGSVALQAVDRLGKLYIADHGPNRTDQTDGVVTIADKDQLTSAAIDLAGDWNDLGVVVAGDLLEISAITTGGDNAPGGGAAKSVFTVTAVEAGFLTFSPELEHTITEFSFITFRVFRGAKVYDSNADTLTRWTTTNGTVPTACPIICLYNDRICMAGDPDNPGVWYMSRHGLLDTDGTDDWNYGASDLDPGRAIAGISSDSDAGGLAVPITAMVPYSDDYLLISGEAELWVLRGDPTFGGLLDNLSYTIGIIQKAAWCHTPDGTLAFLSKDGIYMIPRGANVSPQAISRESLPVELRDIDTDANTITMMYDVFFEGVHVYITPSSKGPASHWWMDWSTSSFWPVVLDSTHDPHSLAYYAHDNTVVLGCRDGYVRKYDNAQATDDGTAFNSHLLIGPIRLGGNDSREGLLKQLIAALAENSGAVDWSVHVGSTAEEAKSAAAFASGTWTAGLNFHDRMRARGHSCYVKLANNTTSAWAMERLSATRKDFGPQRKS